MAQDVFLSIEADKLEEIISFRIPRCAKRGSIK